MSPRQDCVSPTELPVSRPSPRPLPFVNGHDVGHPRIHRSAGDADVGGHAMQWFHDRGALAKLLGSFGAVCAVMALVGWMGLSTAQGINEKLEGVGGNNLPSIRALNRTKAAIVTAQRDIRSAILVEDMADVQAQLGNVKQGVAAID